MAITANLTKQQLDRVYGTNDAARAVFGYFKSLTAGLEAYIPFVTGREGAAYAGGVDVTNSAAYTTGTITNTAGSNVVTGVTGPTLFQTAVVEKGWFLTFVNETKRYRVRSVDTEAQITLSETVPKAHTGVTYTLTSGVFNFDGTTTLQTSGITAGMLIQVQEPYPGVDSEAVWYTIEEVVSETKAIVKEPIVGTHAAVTFTIEDRAVITSRDITFTYDEQIMGFSNQLNVLFATENASPGVPDPQDPLILSAIGSSAAIASGPIRFDVAAKGVHVHNQSGNTISLHVAVGLV